MELPYHLCPPNVPVNGHWASCFLLHFFPIQVLPEVLRAYLSLVQGVVESMCPYVGTHISQRTLLSTISRALFTSFGGDRLVTDKELAKQAGLTGQRVLKIYLIH